MSLHAIVRVRTLEIRHVPVYILDHRLVDLLDRFHPQLHTDQHNVMHQAPHRRRQPLRYGCQWRPCAMWRHGAERGHAHRLGGLHH